MTLKELRKVFDYSTMPVNLIVLASDGTNIKIEYSGYEQFKELKDFDDYKVVSILASKYFFDVFVSK